MWAQPYIEKALTSVWCTTGDIWRQVNILRGDAGPPGVYDLNYSDVLQICNLLVATGFAEKQQHVRGTSYNLYRRADAGVSK